MSEDYKVIKNSDVSEQSENQPPQVEQNSGKIIDEANYKELYRLCKDAADNNLAIKELKDFLDGVYKFDEACLTS